MGTDIHVFVETIRIISNSQPSIECFAELFLSRDTTLFSILADAFDTHNEDNFLARGLPDNISHRVKSAYGIEVAQDCEDGYSPRTHNTNCRTPAEAEALIQSGIGYWLDEERCLLGGTVWHHPSWLTTHELVKVKSRLQKFQRDSIYLDAIIALMDALDKSYGQSRLVFWFDG